MTYIAFIGTVEFGRHCPIEVSKNGGNIMAAFTPAEQHAGFHFDCVNLLHGIMRHGAPIGIEYAEASMLVHKLM